MANINKIQVENVLYDIEDTTARSSAVTMSSRADGSVSLSSASAGTSVNVPSLTNFGDPGLLEDDAVTEINTLKTDVSDLKSQITSCGIKASIKQALLLLAQNVVYIDEDGQDVYDALYDALYEIDALSVTATINQTDLIFTCDSLDSIKKYLTVTVSYDDGTSEVTNNYTLSGTLTAGTSTITVLAGDKSTTVNVTVTAGTDVTPALSTFINDGNSVSHEVSGNSIRVHTSSAGQYLACRSPITLESGYTYRTSYDALYTSGEFKVTYINRSTNSTITGSSVPSSDVGTQSGSYTADKLLSEASNFTTNAFLKFFVTWSTSEVGDVTFSNLRVVKYIATN